MAAYKLKADVKLIHQMLRDNEHNKHTTLYYLLAKKKERGDLELEKELEEYAEKEMKREQDKLKKAKKSKLTPPPIEILDEPEMYAPKFHQIERPARDSKQRKQSKSIGLSIDHDQINQDLDYSKIYIKQKQPSVKVNDISFKHSRYNQSIDKQPKQTAPYTPKKSASKSRSKRPASRDLGLKL